VVVKVGWEDNPWFPEVLRSEMEHCKATDIDAWHHIWQGNCVNTLKGAVYAAQLRDVDSQGRVTRVPYDSQRPVNTYWDLGVDDSTSIWFVQSLPMGEHRLIDYLEGSGEGLPYYLRELQQKGYIYGTHHLPHDGRARQLGTGKSIEELMRIAGMKVMIVPKLSVADGINAARTLFPNCWFDGDKCKDGLQALRHYTYGEKEELGVKTKEPVHNWASHGSDAFRYFAVGVRTPKPQTAAQPQRPRAPLSAWS
jgi:phage terminase large subunit